MNFNIDFSKMSYKQIHEYILNIDLIVIYLNYYSLMRGYIDGKP